MPKRKVRKKDEILLGIDYGETNIGVALGRARLAAPVGVINGKNENSALNEIARIALENKVGKIVLGLPLTPSNKETKKSLVVRRFAKLLKIKLKKPVVLVNEYASSQEATKAAITAGIAKRKRRKIDHLAAALILNKYYEQLE